MVRSHLQRDGPDGSLISHRRVERSCQWDVHLRRYARLLAPSPRCCGRAKVESPSTQKRPELCQGLLNDLHFFDRQAPESIEVGKASEQFLLGVPKTLGFKFSGDRRNIKHQLSSAVISPAILAHIFCVHFIFTTLLALRLRNLVNIVLCSGGAAWATLQSRVCFRTFWTGQLV